jgi:antitoxin component of MazEF toxin-antitoxin module
VVPGQDMHYNIIPMRKTLARIGDSTGLIIDKPILELMNLKQGDEVDLDLVEEALVIRPARGKKKDANKSQRKDRLAALKIQMLKDIGETLRKLAK